MSATSVSCQSDAPVRWGDHSAAPHTVQFYGDDTFLVDELAGYIGGALLAGDSAVVIATKAHRTGLAQQLQSRSVDSNAAAGTGRYIALDAEEILRKFMVDRWPDEALFTSVVGSVVEQAAAAASGKAPHVSAFGEMVALLWSRGNTEAAIRLEQLWNHLMQHYPLSLRCAYPMSGFHREDQGSALLKICAQHSHVIPVESYTALSSEEQRGRRIAYLQHKALALETEVAERKQVEAALRQTQSELENLVEQRTSALRQLSSRLLNLQDTERRRIARELHDSLGQYLVGLKLNVDMVRRSPGREDLWLAAEELMQQCMTEVRTLSYLLHPPTMDAAGFASAARWYAEGFSQRSGVEVTLDVPDNLGRLPDSLELALFRVLQEALTNVHRHSGASRASVTVLEDAEQVILEVRDNGQGIAGELLARFRETGAGMGVGLAGIRERAWELGGGLAVDSGGDGTLVRVTLPLAAEDDGRSSNLFQGSNERLIFPHGGEQ